MATEKLPASENATNEQLNLAEQAAESMLGPNPFIGLRLEDIVASFKTIGRQAVQDPKLVIEQEAALIRDLISVMAGQSDGWTTTARLLGRTGFGVTGAQVDHVAKQSCSKYVDAALGADPEADPGARATPMPMPTLPAPR